MISLEAYRSAVGCWNGRRAYHKPFKEKFVHNSDLQWSERDRMIEAQVIMLYKRLFLLLLGAVVMPLLLLYTTQTLFANRPVSHPNKDYVRKEFVRMSKQLIQTLLVMAGIEKNPGEQAVVVLQDLRMKSCIDMMHTHLAHSTSRSHCTLL